jgi:hypothetical protein
MSRLLASHHRAVIVGLGIGLMTASGAALAQAPAPSGTVFTIAGNGLQGYSGDGVGRLAAMRAVVPDLLFHRRAMTLRVNQPRLSGADRIGGVFSTLTIYLSVRMIHD